MREKVAQRGKNRLVDAAESLRAFPLHTRKDYEKAVRLIEPLAIKKSCSREERDFLDVMTILIERYDEEHFPIGSRNLHGIAFLKHLLEENRMSSADLGRILGTRTQGYPILRGDRDLSKKQMVILGEFFGLPPSLFFDPPRPGKTRAGSRPALVSHSPTQDE